MLAPMTGRWQRLRSNILFACAVRGEDELWQQKALKMEAGRPSLRPQRKEGIS